MTHDNQNTSTPAAHSGPRVNSAASLLARIIRMLTAAVRTVPGIALTLLLPKCPLCLAALLTSLGLGSAFAKRVAPWLHAAWFSLGCAAVAAPLIVWLLYTWRARSACSCNASASFAPSSSRRT